MSPVANESPRQRPVLKGKPLAQGTRLGPEGHALGILGVAPRPCSSPRTSSPTIQTSCPQAVPSCLEGQLCLVVYFPFAPPSSMKPGTCPSDLPPPPPCRPRGGVMGSECPCTVSRAVRSATLRRRQRDPRPSPNAAPHWVKGHLSDTPGSTGNRSLKGFSKGTGPTGRQRALRAERWAARPAHRAQGRHGRRPAGQPLPPAPAGGEQGHAQCPAGSAGLRRLQGCRLGPHGGEDTPQPTGLTLRSPHLRQGVARLPSARRSLCPRTKAATWSTGHSV